MVMKMKEIRSLSADQRASRLVQYRQQLMELKSQLSAGGSIDDPGKIKGIKKTIARLETIKREEELKINQ